jgi:hypothetical protein
MGLDQYWVLGPTKEEEAFALITGNEIIRNDFGYHRKFWKLHHFLHQYAKTEDFNCEELIIDEKIYHDLLDFLVTEPDYVLQSVLLKVREYLAEGRTVIYYGSY